MWDAGGGVNRLGRGGAPFGGSAVDLLRAAPASPLYDVACLPRLLPLDSASEPTLFCLFPPRSWGLTNWRFARPLGFEEMMPLPAAGGRVSPISTSESSVSAGALAARLPAGIRVALLQVGAGFEIISHAHLAR